ncbi:hypothetical protein LTR35_011675 [Friedmanniomyces endolithicus]|uniref:Hypervirulence associated protein TUDOR domain-containing protein n=1 Tax=Friedmanniomyces endolithicus TaxID=329885 RepID=A0AAN6J946_9PEZI|nr:hypothetical protein LTR35_011675 [Friedmanniomyces endolithicus]KAK0287807.1 hypothetical protein LTS00_009921 [Friedmanniomyces endolithicus]KAK0314901.1 hypothetical protein LTR82_012893 [Friedmanniomyces endolithicus]KAK0994682.1 hypothetical protein LTR54_010781 [Friedmanniomyces endolithicus]
MQFITLSLAAFATFAVLPSGAPIGDKGEMNTHRVVVKAEKSTLWAPRDAEVKEVHALVEHPRVAEKSTVWATRDVTAKTANVESKHPAMTAEESTLSASRNADADLEGADVLVERHPVAMEKSTLWAPRDADLEAERATLWATRDAGAEVTDANGSLKRPVVPDKATVWAPRDVEAEVQELNVSEKHPKQVEKMTIWARTRGPTNTLAGYIDSASTIDVPAHGEHTVDSHARSAHINDVIIEAIPKRADQAATPATSDDDESIHALARSSDIEMPPAPKKIDPRKCWQKGTC